jgi:AraC-like DNA-binding protein
LTGVSLVEFVRRHRLNKAAMILEQDKLPITEVAYMTGFPTRNILVNASANSWKNNPLNTPTV